MYRDEIIKSYNLYKEMANSFYKKGDMDSMFECLHYACAIMHCFQIQLSDMDIENLLRKAAEHLIGDTEYEVKNNKEIIMMYDSLGVDSIALSMQYVSALTKLGVPFVYVFDGKQDLAEQIIRTVSNSFNGEIIIVNKNLNYCEKFNFLYDCIHNVKPKYALLHMDNKDVVGAAIWSCVTGVSRYFVNHGDEQFWVGNNSMDYLICFRDMGANTAIQYRGISPQKIVILPYYPVESDVMFQGWEFEIPNDSVLLFSGGRFKKIYGENNEFSKMVAHILKENNNAFFIFAGNGDAQPFIDELKLENVLERCKIIPYRKDLSNLMKHVDIYLGTYPQSGGLMTQYAAKAGIPIVERDCMVGGVSEDLLPKLDSDIRITYQSLEEYYSVINALIASKERRLMIGHKIQAGVISKEEFETGLQKILFQNKEWHQANDRISNVDLRSKRIIDGDRLSVHILWRMLLSKYILKKSPFMFIKAVCMQIRYFGFFDLIKKAVNKFTKG